MKSHAQRQAAYRKRFERLDIVVSVGTAAKLRDLAARDGRSQRACLESLVASERLDDYLGSITRQRVADMARRTGRTPKAFLAAVLRRLEIEERRRGGPVIELSPIAVVRADH